MYYTVRVLACQPLVNKKPQPEAEVY